MVSWVEVGLFLYVLAGSATIGYWLLISYSPGFNNRDKNTKLGYSVIAGLLYASAIFVISIFLVSGQYNNLNFLETFFWLTPLSFVILALTAAIRRARILIERAQYGETVPAEKEEKLETSLLKPAISGMEKIGATAEPLVPSAAVISDSSEQPEPEEKIAEEIPEESGTIEEAGETEKDVVEEIRRIMKGEPTAKEKKQDQIKKAMDSDLDEKEQIRKIMQTGSGESDELPSALAPEEPQPPAGIGEKELEKIKQDLKQKIKTGENSEKIREGLKKKEKGKN